MMDGGRKIKALLESQRDCYRAMKQTVEKQAIYIQAMDIGGLTAGAAETRAMMCKIRDIEAELRPFRQIWHKLGLDRPFAEKRQVDALVEDIRALIASIQEIKDRNVAMLERSMGEMRQEMAGMKARTRASRAYQQRPVPASDARFIDRSN